MNMKLAAALAGIALLLVDLPADLLMPNAADVIFVAMVLAGQRLGLVEIEWL